MSKIVINQDRCKGCLLCIDFCPKGVIRLNKDLNKRGCYFVRYEGRGCVGCMRCAIICPETCIEVYK